MKLKNLLFTVLTAAIAMFATSCDKKTNDRTDVELSDAKDLFSYEISGYTTSDLTIDIEFVKGAKVGNYVVGVLPIDYYDSNDEAFAKAIFASIEAKGGDATIADNEYVFDSEVKTNLASTWALEAGDYVIGIFAVDKLGARSSDIIAKKVTLEAASTESFTLKLVDVGDVTCTMMVTMDASFTGNYFLACGSNDYIEEDFGGDLNAYAEAIIDDELNYYQTDLSEVDEQWIFNTSGVVNVGAAWVLTQNTKHTAFVFGIESDGTITTAISSITFTTEKTKPSTNAFELTVSNITADGAVVSVTAENDDPYYFDIIPTESLEYGDEAVIADVIAAVGQYLPSLLSYGDDTYDFSPYLEPSTNYTAIAFGTNGSSATTGLWTSDEFTTLSGGSNVSSMAKSSYRPLVLRHRNIKRPTTRVR